MRVVAEWDRGPSFNPEEESANQAEAGSSPLGVGDDSTKFELLGAAQGVFNGAVLGALLWAGILAAGFGLQNLIFR